MPLDSPAAEIPTSETLRALKIIDSDTHFTEPHDMWIKRVPVGSKFRERVPQVRVLNGVRSWYIDGDKSIGHNAEPHSTIRKDGSKAPGLSFMQHQIEDVHEGSWNVKARLAMMDEQNVFAHILYPNILGFGGQRSAKVDPELRLVSVQIYNDAMADVQRESGGRLFPMALVPWWSLNDAVKEIERCAAMGLRGINVNSDPHVHKGEDGQMLPDLGQPYWDPLWDVCIAHKLPVNFHIGGSEQVFNWYGEQAWPCNAGELHAGLGGAMMFFANGRVMANLIYSGVCDRKPGLQFVSVESGVGWIPFLLQALDYQYIEITLRNRLRRMPSEYFKTNFHACFWFERKDLAAGLRQVGIDNVMFETDFPHPTSLYPINNAAFALPGLTDEEKRKVLSSNAAKLYNIPVR